MKSITITLQALGIIMVLPLYVFLELNHQPGKTPLVDTVPKLAVESTIAVENKTPNNLFEIQPQHPVIIILKDF